MTVRFESLLPNWWSCCRHKSHLRCGDRTWFPDFNWNCPGHTWRIKLHNGPHYIPKVLRLLPRRAIPVQSCSSFDWVGGHRPNVVKVRKTILHRWNHMSWTIKQEDCLLSWVKSNSYSEIEIISNSHPVPYSCKRQEQLQNIKTWTNWQSSFVANIDVRSWKSMEISSILFDFQTTELISQSLQPSQNRAKDPRGTPEHGTSMLRRRRIWNYLSFRIGEALLDINPTWARRQNLVSRFQLKLSWTYVKNKSAQRAALHSSKFCKYRQGWQYLFNPIHPLITR